MSETNAIGRMIALATADAADADGHRPATAMPSAANADDADEERDDGGRHLGRLDVEVVGDDAERRA